MSEKPVRPAPRRLADWINPTGARKVHSLIDKVYKRKNLEMAWECVKANGGSGGVDGQSLEEFEGQLDSQLNRLHTELREDSYQPRPVRQVQIPKAGKPGEFRTLGIPTIYDRVCQQALLNRLEPIFEPVFDEANFGYRRGRSTKDALRKIWKEIQDEGREWIVDADLKDFLDRVNHDKLMAKIAERVSDKRLLRLIRAFLRAGVMENGLVSPVDEGTPQGGPLSPLLSNIVLDEFDRELERRGLRFARYADDSNIYVRSRRAGERVMESLKRFIATKLKLKVNDQKSAVARPWERKFLGFSFTAAREPRRRIAPKAIGRFKERVRELTSRTRGVSTERMAEELACYLRGWIGYFGKCETPSVLQGLEEWFRRRLRSAIWKQWKRGTAQFAELRKRGVGKDLAAKAAGSAHGPWRLANSPALAIALPNAYFDSLGIPRLTGGR